jgi:WD40 repeat protein
MKSCPETQKLKELLDETLRASERDQIEAHVEICADCESALESMTCEHSAFLSEPPFDEEIDQLTPAGERFRILGRFHGGGQGDLFKARDEELQREVAVKKIKSEYADDWRRRAELIREALITGNLEHPGIVPVYGLGCDAEGQSYYAMRLIRRLVEGGERGNTLHDAIIRFRTGEGDWTLRKLLDRFIAVCNTIQYAHDQGVLHCDLKPANIILGPYGETLVLDWGAARALREIPGALAPARHENRGSEETEAMRGLSAFIRPGGFQLTPDYASPEQTAGRELGRASDVYSLGATLHCLLTGRPPQGPTETSSGLARGPADLGLVLEPHPRNTRVPRPLAAICAKALSRRPQDRYPSARDLADDVGHWLAQELVSAYREGWIDRAFRLARRHRAWAIAGAAALLIVTCVSVVGAFQVNQAWREAVGLSSEVAHNRGMALCEQADVQRGVLWLGRSLEILPGNAGDLRRLNLSGWCRRLCSLKVFHRLPGAAEPLACDPGGKFIVTGDADGSAHLWEAATGNRIGPEPLMRGVALWAFSSDGGIVLLGDREGKAQLWNTSDGNLRCRLPVSGHKLIAAAFNQDGSAVLTSSGREARLWHTGTGRALGPPVDTSQGVRSVALASDGKTAVIGGRDGAARLYDATTARLLAPPLAHQKRNTAITVAISPDGRTVLTGGTDQTAQFWNARTGAPIGPPLEHPGAVDTVLFSPDGRTALTGAQLETGWLWNATTAKPIGRPLQHQQLLRTVSFSPDSRLVLTGSDDMTARLWNAATGEPLNCPLAHEGPIHVAAFSDEGRRILTVSADGTTRIWAVPPERGAGVLVPSSLEFDLTEHPNLDRHPQSLAAQSSSPQTTAPRIIEPQYVNSLASDRSGRVLLVSSRAKAELCDPLTGRQVGPTIRHGATILTAHLSPDGLTILTAGNDALVKLWDATTGEPKATLPHDDDVNAATFHPVAGRRVAVTGSVDGTARIWNLVTGQPIGRVMKHRAWVRAVAYSPDGRRIFTGCEDGTVWQWDSDTGEQIGDPRRLQSAATRVYFNPLCQGVLMCASDGTARVWNLATGQLLGAPLSHRGAVLAGAFSPSGQFLLTGAADGGLRLWEVATGRAIGPPLYLPERITALAFGPAGRSALAGGTTGRARMWNFAQPIGDDIERFVCWSHVVTGLEVDRGGITHLLSVEQWLRERRHLHELGGLPSL